MRTQAIRPKATCLTCHDGRSDEPNHVVLPAARSALCFACHEL